jgi:hypothetical protein
MEFYLYQMKIKDHLHDYNELLLKNVHVLEEELVSNKYKKHIQMNLFSSFDLTILMIRKI